MKTKVIIITRSFEYIENNVEREGREEFGKPILDELNNKKNYSANKFALKRMLLAKKEVDSLGENFASKAEDDYGIDISKDDDDIKKELIKKIAAEKNIDDDKKCYVSFVHDKYDIVLLLWDKLECCDDNIEPFELFVEAICKDCGVEEQSNDANKAILYIHDKQFGIDKDETIVPGCKHTDEPYVTLKKYFYYVAAFQHKSDSGLFKSKILKFNFPCLEEEKGTLAEKIDSKVNVCNTAKDWRKESDAIIQNSAK